MAQGGPCAESSTVPAPCTSTVGSGVSPDILCRHLVITSPVTAFSGTSFTWSPAPGQVPGGQGPDRCAASLLRIFVIWALSSWFRRGPAPQDQTGPGGAPRVASRNLFPKDTLMVTVG
jgi:hypothetical protein